MAAQTEEPRAGGADERRERGGRHVRDHAQRLDILGVIGEFIIADQRAVGLAAGRSEFIFVDLLEELALVEFDRPAEIAVELALAHVERADLQGGPRLAVHDEVVEAPPAAFELLELRRVHDRRELGGDLLVDEPDRFVEGDRQVFLVDDRSFERLFGQRAQQFLRLLRLGLLGCRDRLIEQAEFGSGGSGLCGGLGFGRGHDHAPFSGSPAEPSDSDIFFKSSLFCSTRSSSDSRSSERSTFDMRSRSLLRVSISFFSAGT